MKKTTKGLLGSSILAISALGFADEVELYSNSTLNASTGTIYIEGGPFVDPVVTYSSVDNKMIFEGDIVLGETPQVDGNSQQSIGITGANVRWPAGIIPYTIDNSLSAVMQTRVVNAIQHWEDRTDIDLVLRDANNQNLYPDFVTFIAGSGCSSNVGKVGGEQFIRLATGCSTGNTIHEIGHAVGLWHEQSRADRNTFIQINLGNIQAGREHNFNQHINDGIDLGNYDYGSIMHYGETAFTSNGNDTITILNALPPGVVVGQRAGLSDGDVLGVSMLYGGGGQLHNGSFGSYDAYSKNTSDINNDNVDDLVWMYSGSSGLHAYTAIGNGDGTFLDATGGQLHSGSFGSYDAYTKNVLDVNGDGNADLIWMYSGTSGLHAYTALSNGDGSFETATGGRLHSGSFGSYDAYTKNVLDVNGDGNGDLIWMYSGTSGLHAYTALANGDGSFSAAKGGQLHSGSFGTYDAYTKNVSDVNGDGNADLIWMYSGVSGLHAYTALSNGSGSFLAATGGRLHSGSFGSYDAYTKNASDINGDGYADLIWMYSGSSGLHAYTALSNGKGSFATATGGQLHSGSFGTYDAYVKNVADVNGDGNSDLIWMYSGTSGLHAYTALSLGNGQFVDADGGLYRQGSFGDYTAYSKKTGDVNGDGNEDLIWMYSGSSGLYSFQFSVR